MTTTITTAPITLNKTPEKKSWLGEYLSPAAQAVMKARRIALSNEQIEAAERNAPKGREYDRNRADQFFPDSQGWSPSPTRRTAKRWKVIPSVVDHRHDAVESGAQAREFGAAKVRLLADDHTLTHLGRGSVVEVPLVAYSAHRARFELGGRPTAEPVEDDEPLSQVPIVAMSSDFTLARNTAARALKVEPDSLSVRAVWTYFANLRVTTEKFHGLGGR